MAHIAQRCIWSESDSGRGIPLRTHPVRLIVFNAPHISDKKVSESPMVRVFVGDVVGVGVGDVGDVNALLELITSLSEAAIEVLVRCVRIVDRLRNAVTVALWLECNGSVGSNKN